MLVCKQRNEGYSPHQEGPTHIPRPLPFQWQASSCQYQQVCVPEDFFRNCEANDSRKLVNNFPSFFTLQEDSLQHVFYTLFQSFTTGLSSSCHSGGWLNTTSFIGCLSFLKSLPCSLTGLLGIWTSHVRIYLLGSPDEDKNELRRE